MHGVQEEAPSLASVSVSDPAVHARHFLLESCSAATDPFPGRNVPIGHSMQVLLDDVLHFPGVHIAHALVDDADAFPATQGVHAVPPAPSSVSVTEPALQAMHKSTLLCSAAVEKVSTRNFPGRQSVHTELPALLHLPALHVTHALVGATDAFPGIQGKHSVAPKLVRVFVTDPAGHVKHFSIALCSNAAVAASVRYFPAPQRMHVAIRTLLHVPAPQTKHFSTAPCSAANVPASAKYVPATQFVQFDAAALLHVPAPQTEHFPIASCSTADVAASAKYVPAMQFVHLDATPLLHVPALQMEHVADPELLHFPATQSEQSASAL